jgi:hypothetical protein
MEVLVAIERDPHVRARAVNRAVPAALERIVDRCLAKDPTARYANAGEVGADLDRLLAGSRARRWAVLVAAILVLSIGAAAGVFAYMRVRYTEKRRAAVAAVCEPACARLAGCGLASGRRTCLEECLDSSGLYAGVTSSTPCSAAARGPFLVYCHLHGGIPTGAGKATCRQTIACQDACRSKGESSAECACACVSNLDLTLVGPMSSLWMCGRYSCPSCADDGDSMECARCRKTKCAAPDAACR